MTGKGTQGLKLGAAVAAALLLASVPSGPAAANSTPQVKIDRKKARSIGFFSPAASDPHQAALFERVGGSFAESSFRFTPSGANSKRAVTVAIRARAANRSGLAKLAQGTPSSVPNALAPSAYSLGASLGWKHFALTGDYARIDGGVLRDDRELADIGLGYSGSKWSTRLLFGAERSTGGTSLIGPDQALSVDLGGSYSLTRNLELSGGIRYKSQRDDLGLGLTNDQRRDSQAVYIGTAFRF